MIGEEGKKEQVLPGMKPEMTQRLWTVEGFGETHKNQRQHNYFGVFHFIWCNMLAFLNWIFTFIEIDTLRLHYYIKHFSDLGFYTIVLICSESEENEEKYHFHTFYWKM